MTDQTPRTQRSLFTGLSAFPLTPIHDEKIDEAEYVGLLERLVAAQVDSITPLGSTGSYAYLSTDERARVTELTVANSGHTPVLVGVGALRTRDVLANVESAQAAGAQGLLLAPVSYQSLTEADVFELFRTVAAATDLPLVVYDNPGTTHFTFTTELYGRLAALDGIASIKIPGFDAAPDAWTQRVDEIRAAVGDHVSIGVSGDGFGAAGLNAGCDAWYTAIGGTLPTPMADITRAALAGETEKAALLSAALQPLWDLFSDFGGSLRVVAAVAEHLGLVRPHSLPLPLLGLDDDQKRRVAEVVDRLELS
ncbi:MULTISPECIES: dihydrodipicolinate synthase family protein [Brevibacterium]|uniref:4-hydroxy-tetrahydrodipicolinate synthase n=1 Tax=Brevibacterium antiquum CNRZ 918 TaxID=1255637 RepID=A0A2H1JAF6_9MICO|nr:MULTISPECIES: dihydrodipicolinate synthase family protein [Brevibacterium]SMX84361.1 4-hydroxy-tetrahydrodipicolinate synthase [Brevibacterium antiquum CNRZ 918]HCG57062.1 dihydrodipicolinate synthase family protein [Brevibacterium sp.]